jgi:hypothetical protein
MAAPCAMAAAHSALLMAGSRLQSAVPARTLAINSPGCGASVPATPQSTTVSARPCWRASTDTAAPPASMLATICAVTACG